MSSASSNRIGVAGHICLDLTPALDRERASRRVCSTRSVPWLRRRADASPTPAVSSPTSVSTSHCSLTSEMTHSPGAARAGDPARTRCERIPTGGSTSYSIVVQPPHTDRTFCTVGANGSFDGSSIELAARSAARRISVDPAHSSSTAHVRSSTSSSARRAGIVTSLDLGGQRSDDASEPCGVRCWPRSCSILTS